MATRNYETYIIVDGNFEDSAVEEIITKYEALLKKNEAEISNTERIGRKRLAYPINNKQNGFYICIEFSAKPSTISALERAYKLDENLMRFLTIFLDKRTIQARDDYFKKRAMNLARLESEKKAAEEKAAADSENKSEKKTEEAVH